MIDINVLLKTMFENKASDLHIRVGTPPTFRVHGALFRAHMEPVSFQEMEQMCAKIMRPEQKEVFDKTNEMDSRRPRR